METAVLAPYCQVVQLTALDCLIVVVDGADHSHVVCKLDEEVGASCAVEGQKSEEEGAQHTCLGGPMFNVMVRCCC